MIDQITNCMIQFINSQLGVQVWDGEIPRYDVNGNAITPQSVVTPSNFPVVKVFMKEGGFSREDHFENTYNDTGDMLIQIWGTSRAQLVNPNSNPQGIALQIEVLLGSSNNWVTMGNLYLPSLPAPMYIISMMLNNWYVGQEEDRRTGKQSEFLYRCDMHYTVKLHGGVSII